MTIKFSQDHLEHFFNSVRSCLGKNTNPTTVQFTAAFKKLLFGASNKSKNGNCLADDHLAIMSYPVDTKKAIEHVETEYDLDMFDSWLDIYERSEALDSEYKDNVVTYMSGYVQKALESKIGCVYCAEKLKEDEKESCKMIKKKDFGGLTKPSLNVNTVVHICDKLLRQMIKESNILQERNVMQKLTAGVISVLNQKALTVFSNFDHSDDPSVLQKHSIIIVKKIIQESKLIMF